jgi:hypothetical protein
VGTDEEHADGRVGHRSIPSGSPAGRGDRRFEVEDLALEPIEIRPLAGDDVALLGEERGEVTVDGAVLEAEPRDGVRRPPARGRGVATTRRDGASRDPLRRTRGTHWPGAAAAGNTPACSYQRTADGATPARSGQLCDPHAQIVDLRVT